MRTPENLLRHGARHGLRALVLLTIPLALGASAQRAALAPAFEVERVPLPPGSKIAADINASGEVIAIISDSGLLRSFHWHEGTLTEYGYPAGLDIGGARGLAVKSIADDGTATGQFMLDLSVRRGWQPARWEGSTATELPLPPNSSTGSWFHSAISPAGLIVACGWFIDDITPGWTDENGWDSEPDFFPGNDPRRGFLWDQEGTLQVLPTAPSAAGPNQTGTRVRDVNDAGQVLLWQEDPHLVTGFLYDPEVGVRRLPTHGARSGVPNALNSQGEIAGLLQFSSDNSGYPNNRPALWIDGRLIELELLPGHTSGVAEHLNDATVVVGSLYSSDFSIQTAFRYADGRMQDLQDLIPARSAADLDRPFAINAKGQIVVAGTLRGNAELFLLTPLELPQVSHR